MKEKDEGFSVVDGVSVVAGLVLATVLVSVVWLVVLLELLDGVVVFLPHAARRVATSKLVANSFIFFIFLVLLLFTMEGKACGLVVGHDGNIGYLNPSGLVGKEEDNISNVLGLQGLDSLVKLGGSFLISMEAHQAKISFNQARLDGRDLDVRGDCINPDAITEHFDSRLSS